MFLNSSNVPTNVETACVNLILIPPTKYASNTQLNEGFSHIFLFLLLSVPFRVVLQLVISTGTAQRDFQTRQASSREGASVIYLKSDKDVWKYRRIKKKQLGIKVIA